MTSSRTRTSTTITRLATSAVVTGLATLASAAPAAAMEPKDPSLGVPGSGTTVTSTDDTTPWMEIGIGALGGLALAGAGVAAATSVRHRHAVSPV